MANILLAVPRFHTNLWFATRAMVEAGHTVCVMVNASASGEDHSHVVPTVLGRDPSAPEVYDAMSRFAPDLVLVRNAWGLSRRVAAAARQQGAPLFAYDLRPMTEIPGPWRRLKLWWQRKPRARVTPVAGLDPKAPRDPAAWYLPWPVAALPAEPVPHDPGRLNLLFVGKINLGRKNRRLLIDVIDSAGLGGAVHLTLMGSGGGSKPNAADAVDPAAGVDWISVVPPVPFQDMSAYYAAADACVLPSFSEPLGMAPVEAMAYGAVPIVSDEAGSAGYITHGRDGFVIDPHRPETIADALRTLVDDRPRLDAMKAAARHTAQTELSEARFLERLQAILDHTGGRQVARDA